MLFTFISTSYSKSTNNELGDPIPQNIQSLISNLEGGELPNNLEKLHLGGKKITIKRTEIKIEENSDPKTHSSSSSVDIQTKNKYTNKRGIVLNINENPSPITSTSDNKITPSKFQSLNSTAKDSTTQLIDKPQTVQNSEKIPTHPVFPIENLVSFIRVLEENLEQLPEDEQDRNREFDLHTDKGKVHLQRISLNKNDINGLREAAATNIAKQKAIAQNKQHTAITKRNSLLSNNRVKNFLTSPFTDISNRDNLFENHLSENTEIENSKNKADKIVAKTIVEPINNQTPSDELKRGVIDVPTTESHEAGHVVAEKSSGVAKDIDNIVSTGNPQTTSKSTDSKTNQSEQKKTTDQPKVNVQGKKQELMNSNKNPKTNVMTPNSLSDEDSKKSTTGTKASTSNVDKSSNLLGNLNSFNLKTSDLNPPRALLSTGKSSEFLSQLKSIFNKMSTGSALGGGYFDNNFVEENDIDEGSNLMNNDSEDDGDDDDDDD